MAWIWSEWGLQVCVTYTAGVCVRNAPGHVLEDARHLEEACQYHQCIDALGFAHKAGVRAVLLVQAKEK
jgi:hypothetical protein